MASQLPLTSHAGSWLQTATHTKDILPSIQTALTLQCSELRTVYLHQPCETTHTLTDILSSQHIHGASHLDSAEYTLVLEVICQKVLYGGHTGGCAPLLLLPGHVGQQETLVDYEVGQHLQAENLVLPMLALLLPASTNPGEWLCLSKDQFPSPRNEDKNSFPTFLRVL